MDQAQLLVSFKYVHEQTHPTIEFTCTSSTPSIAPSSNVQLLNDVPMVQFPYTKPYRVKTSAVKAKTTYQLMKINLAQKILHAELIAERNKFFKNENTRKLNEDQKRNASAVKIQALYRGHCLRESRAMHPSPKRRSMKKAPIHRRDVQEELRQLAANLRLKPIPGLNLDAVPRRSKTKDNIAIAAAIQLQCFLRAAFAKRLFRVRAHLMQQKREKRAGLRIMRFFIAIRKRKEMAQRRITEETRAAVRIQSWVRGMLDRMRYLIFAKVSYLTSP